MSDTSTSRTQAEIDADVAKAHAEAAKALAEAAKLEHEALKAKAEADKAAYDARLTLLKVTEEERKRSEQDAADVHHQVYRFTGGVEAASVDKAITKLTEWHRLADAPRTIEVVFFSPGGLVIEGLALFDHMRWLSEQGHHIITGCTGMAASMGGILIQAGDYRWMSAESWYMIHRVAFGVRGKTFEIEDELKFTKRMEERIVKIFASRSGGKLSAAKIKRNWDRTDWWIDSAEALDLGLVDEIRGTLPGIDAA